MIKIGDKVSFLNEKGYGIVTQIKGKDFAIVETDDGFEVPHPINQLVLVKHNAIKIENNEVTINFEIKTGKISLTILPELEVLQDSNHFNLWLVNDTESYLTGVISRDHKGLRNYLNDFRVESGDKKLIGSLSKKEMKFIQFLFVDAILFSKAIFSPKNRIDEAISLKRYNFDDESTFSMSKLFSKLSLELIVYDEEASNSDYFEKKHEKSSWEKDEVINFQNKITNKLDLKASLEKQEKEVDLHIEELLENYHSMGKVEILDFQISIFRRELDKAVDTKRKKIIFIHGIGNGRLKFEIIKILKTYKKIEFQDASYQKYGFGATEVLIK